MKCNNVIITFTLIKSVKYNLRIVFIFVNLLILWTWTWWVSGSNFKYRLNASGKYNIHNWTTPLNTKKYFNYWNRNVLFILMICKLNI